MGSERNFRSHYYEKMGFRGVEEKKSLDILLREKPIDLARIHNFCLRFPLPGIYRVQVWQLLVGVMPVHTTSTEFVWSQRAEMYREMERSLLLTRKISPNTDTSIKITLVWLLERNCLKFDLSSQLKESNCQNFTSIVQSLQHLVSSPEEVFWLARGIFSILETSLSDTRHMYDCLTKLLEEEASLLAHLDSCGGVQCPQYQQLWRRGLAGVFQPSLLARLWDKLIGGSSKVLAYVLACALFRCKSEVMGAKTENEILDIVTGMKEDRQDVVLTSALEMWEMDGCPVCVESQCGGDNVASHSSHAHSKSSIESRLSMEINVG